jgi:hypothetical protein
MAIKPILLQEEYANLNLDDRKFKNYRQWMNLKSLGIVRPDQNRGDVETALTA